MPAIRTSGKPRKVPADDILLAELLAGETYADIGRRYQVDATCVRTHALRLGWNLQLARVSGELAETAEKIVIRREGYLTSRDYIPIEIAISLPRIPTLHGHYAAARPSAHGA